jgi:hypothetical protein
MAQFALAVAAIACFWLPYRLTGVIASRMTSSRDTMSTYHVLGGALVFLGWIVSLTGIVWAVAGWRFALGAFVALPAVAVAGLYAVERWQRTLLQARRWLILRRHDTRVASLRGRQQELARRLDDALAAHEAIR